MSHSPRIAYRCLWIGGAVLSVLYGAGWGLVLTVPVDGRGRAGLAGSPEDERVGRTVAYRVVTRSGQEHVLHVPRNDPGAVLVEAGRLFGQVVEVERLSAGEAKAPEGGDGSFRWWLGLVLLLPAAMIGAGFVVKGRADVLERTWNAIAPTLSMAAAELKRRTALGDAALKRGIDAVNRRGLAQLVWDSDSDWIYDSRLSSHTLTVSHCARCNEPLNQRMLADLRQVPRCPECMFQHDTQLLNQLKAGIVERLREESKLEADRRAAGNAFSVGQFAVLTLLFPPASIAYALKQT